MFEQLSLCNDLFALVFHVISMAPCFDSFGPCQELVLKAVKHADSSFSPVQMLLFGDFGIRGSTSVLAMGQKENL